ncbi:hypothetical protein [Actinoplanes utahensis]|uniref:Uncharacterized protein n=1 Tax=Actinoplanes utahensis TaxID=1869 RepID=A0A0A6U7W1_ACTUT|nr:hypothetical protein [Actinoplanes utahensis]KHD72140.1 hypothetical protein MB27_41550 [Actinoplanes utahensis]GIF27621.1 hypothetical protein Aut01nite_06070 [Actinoplanes utahensis]
MRHDTRQDATPHTGWQDDGRPDRRRRLLWTLVGLQALLVVPTAYLWLGPASATAAANPEPDLGAGLVGLLLMIAGLPWSMFVCLLDNHYGLFDSGARDVFVLGPAVLNLAITAFGVWWTGRHPVTATDWQVIEDAGDLEDAGPRP